MKKITEILKYIHVSLNTLSLACYRCLKHNRCTGIYHFIQYILVHIYKIQKSDLSIESHYLFLMTTEQHRNETSTCVYSMSEYLLGGSIDGLWDYRWQLFCFLSA